MQKYKIELITMNDCVEFVEKISRCNGSIFLEGENDFKVNARSLIGALAATEWNNLYCVSDNDIYSVIEWWIKNG